MLKRIRKILAGSLIVSCTVSLYVYLNLSSSKIAPQTHSPKVELARNYEHLLNHAKDDDIILTEMVLSLVSNYYVDANQFDFEKLILATLKNMKNHGKLSYRFDKYNIQISNGANYKEIPREWFRDELGRVSAILKIAKFLEATKPNDSKNPMLETLSTVISSLDPYSKLLTGEEYQELKEGTEGEFGGLGIMVGVRNDLLTVIKLLPHSPAHRAGVHPLDHILSVNGYTTFGASLEELVKVMRGSPGTPATISFLRENGKSPFEISMKRELVQIDPLTIQRLKTPSNNEALLLKLDTFSVKSYERLRREIERSLASGKNPAAGIIIDLRSNPGGLLDQAVKISKILVPEGSIVTVKGRDTETEYADRQNLNVNSPVVVLIDEDSASASEILAAALKDHDRAIVIGQPSYGKGTVQTVFELPSGKALKLTIARYLTPSGASIQGVGVIPDIWLHPIFKGEENENLMGHYRYRVDSPFIGFATAKQNHLSQSKFMNGYYLKDHQQPDSKQSKEIELALKIFDEYKKTNKGTNNKNFRSSHFLSKVRKQIESKLDAWDAEASNYLKAKKVDWYENVEGKESYSLSIAEKKLEVPSKILPGSAIAIPFTLKNGSRVGVARVSVFVRAVHRDMDTDEMLIGYIPAIGELKERLEFDIPSYWLAGKVQFQMGIAVNGIELENTIQDFTLDVLNRKEPILSISTKSSKLLKAGEVVDLTVSVKNDGDENIQLDRVKLLNLSGSQMSVKGDTPSKQEVKAHEETSFSIKLKGTNEIFSNQLTLGLSVESHQLKNTLYKIIQVSAVPTAKPNQFSEIGK